MRALLIYPRFPQSFWSFEKTLALGGFKVQLPPLGIITAAAIFPQEWEFKLVDRNIRDVTDEEWEWAEIVMLSAMIVQKADFAAQIKAAKEHGKPVAVGGPYPTAVPSAAEAAGADFLVLDEGEITIPMFVEALERGERRGIFRSNGQRPDVATTPIPRYDLLELDAYAEMSVQYSRGCPFQCEFCDIIVLYGRTPRTKTPEQFLAELTRLYELGWRRSVFVVDDNFIGNRGKVKLMLAELKKWLEEHAQPFTFGTEASIDLAQDDELMRLMVEARFGTVFIGLETPDVDSLTLTRKHQNLRDSLDTSIEKISAAGLRVMGGFIIGFDGEQPGADQRIVEFIERNAIPTAMLSMLQALPGTALTDRLKREGRMLSDTGDVNQTTVINFVPTRPADEIRDEYIRAFWRLYEPRTFLDRTFRHYLILGRARSALYRGQKKSQARSIDWTTIRAMLQIAWRQGILRNSRWSFWINLYRLWRRYPAVVGSYLGLCAQAEHFLEYRRTVRREIRAAA